MATTIQTLSRTLSTAALAAMLVSLPAGAGEHPGDSTEHPGQRSGSEHPGDKTDKHEHPGDKADKHKSDKHNDGHEHPGDSAEHPGSASAPSDTAVAKRDSFERDDYGEADIKQAMRDYIDQRTVNGVFRIHDGKTGETLDLSFVKIHDPVRYVDSDLGYFACTDFHVIGQDNKLYDLDFWLVPTDGELAVYREKIHKEPVKPWHRIGWNKQARYTFVNNRIAPVN